MKNLLFFYQYFHPDDVVSAQHYSQLAIELEKRGWLVTAMPSNRSRHDESVTYDSYERWKGIEIKRIWRPRLRQASTLMRGLSALWMIAAWSLAAFRKKSLPGVDAIIVGTDPIMSLFVVLVWKVIRPETKIVHWCFDLFPDIAIANGMLRSESFIVKILNRLFRQFYKTCNLIIDTGPCQRKRLQIYDGSICKASCATCTPWALVEPQTPLPINSTERKNLFGDIRLALFYSGNIGMAYSYDLFIKLARQLHGEDIHIAFGVRGKRLEEIKKAVSQEDTNITFAGFASMDRLQARLSAPDIHLVSLREEWTGTLVPSKFFGSLAVGRPVIFQGSTKSAVSKWIKEYKIGWVLTPETLNSVAEELKRLSYFPEELEQLNIRCHRVYQDFFSKKHVTDIWDIKLRSLFDDKQ